MSTFSLLNKRRFLPFFCVQFLGAFNDNLFKNTMLILLTFGAGHAGASEADSGMLITLAGGLFILPFFLFSAVSGQLADRTEKSRIMRAVKMAEIGIMALGGVGFFLHSTPLLFVVLFLMGTHSTFFGPAKYSILPQHLQENELVAGNAAVEMGTFLAIILGTLAAGEYGPAVATAGVIGVAVLGYAASRYIPLAPATSPGLKLNWNPFTEARNLYRITRKKEAVFNSIMGISWFWYYGAVVLAQIPNFAQHTIGGNEDVMKLLLATFSVAIGIGSVLCERLSHGEIELGIVPVGALGMTIFAVDLFFINYAPGSTLMGVSEFISGPNAAAHCHVLFDLAMIGITSSLFIVPLYALIQQRSNPSERSRVIAANNIFNSIFMVVSAVVTMLFYKAGLNTVGILLVTALMNAVVCAYVFALIPEFVMRFGIWILASTIYRLRYVNRHAIPKEGACLIVANHVSFIDWFIITAACGRPVRFIMDHNYFKNPLTKWFFKLAKAIPIAPSKEDASLKEKAFQRIGTELADGQVVCIFPEGAITKDGKMANFRPGVERILAANPVPVYPVAIKGLWGSFFSRVKGSAMKGVPHPSRREIEVEVGAVLPSTAKAAEMEKVVLAMIA